MNTTVTPGAELLAQVRAGFIAQGMSFSSFCATNEINRSNARQCLLGAWDGPVGRALRQRLIDAACISLMARAS